MTSFLQLYGNHINFPLECLLCVFFISPYVLPADGSSGVVNFSYYYLITPFEVH